MKKWFLLFPVFFVSMQLSVAQVNKQGRIDSIMTATILTGDSIPHIELSEVAVISHPIFKNRREERHYWRLVYNLKKVYPYSKIVAAVVVDVEKELEGLSTDRERRKFIRSVEDSLWGDYEADLRKMTISQGHLLFKLVDRETRNTTYHWIEYYRGKVSAFFWQGIARIFSTNLKSEYDPEGEDKLIEELVTLIEKGYL